MLFPGKSTTGILQFCFIIVIQESRELFVSKLPPIKNKSTFDDFDFFNSPKVVGNAALFYEDSNIEATLSYRYSGTQFESLRTFGLSQFQQARGFLDFDLEYTFRDVGPLEIVSATFEVADILDGGGKFTVNETYGRAGILTDGASFNGRSVRFGLRTRF